MKLPKPLLVLWLRVLAFVLDRIGRKHNLRKRVGQLTRKKRVCAVESVADHPLPNLSVHTEVPK